MSVKRPSRRYIGFRYDPPATSRKAVGAAVERLAGPEPARGNPDSRPRLLVCHEGAGILVVATPKAAEVRKAMAARAGSGEPLSMTSVVTSGTIATVKLRLKLSTRRNADAR